MTQETTERDTSADRAAAGDGSAAAQPRWLARVQVTLKPVVSDPAGASIAQALQHLGFLGVEQVRAGKYFEIELRAADKAAAGATADAMCRQLLANPVVEEYRVTVVRASRPR